MPVIVAHGGRRYSNAHTLRNVEPTFAEQGKIVLVLELHVADLFES